jgi:hypothetical protein
MQIKRTDNKVKVCFITVFDIQKGNVKASPTMLNDDDDDDDNNDKHIFKKTSFNRWLT